MYQLLKQCGIQLCLHTYIMIIKDLCRKIQIRIPKRFSPMLSSSHLARIFTERCYSAVEEPIPEHNVEGLRPTTEMPKQPTFDTSIGPISLNFDESSCLEPDQIPQKVRQSLGPLPDGSQLPPPPPVASSSMMKKNEKNKLRENMHVQNQIVQKFTLNLII